jgi:uncharacterized protein YecE (DUF72 family)
MEILAGTSGFSYKQWLGKFYPEKLPAKQMLNYYAERLPAVEINNTFYRMPRSSVLEGWMEQVPENFRFIIKASRRITHIKRLKEAEEETDYLLSKLDVLGKRLGAILFQLPPFLRKDLDRLNAFLKHLPDGTPASFEFRHASWFDEDICTALSAHNAALCIVDDEGDLQIPFRETAGFGYLRLRRPGYDDEALLQWSRKIQASTWDKAFVMFKHEDMGPEYALKIREISKSI